MKTTYRVPLLGKPAVAPGEITLSDQTRGTEWEYRVIAVNKAREGVPINTVMAVL